MSEPHAQGRATRCYACAPARARLAHSATGKPACHKDIARAHTRGEQLRVGRLCAGSGLCARRCQSRLGCLEPSQHLPPRPPRPCSRAGLCALALPFPALSAPTAPACLSLRLSPGPVFELAPGAPYSCVTMAWCGDGDQQMLSNEGAMVNGLDVTGCGNRLFTGDSKGQIRCWDRHHNKQDLAQVQGARYAPVVLPCCPAPLSWPRAQPHAAPFPRCCARGGRRPSVRRSWCVKAQRAGVARASLKCLRASLVEPLATRAQEICLHRCSSTDALAQMLLRRCSCADALAQMLLRRCSCADARVLGCRPFGSTRWKPGQKRGGRDESGESPAAVCAGPSQTCI